MFKWLREKWSWKSVPHEKFETIVAILKTRVDYSCICSKRYQCDHDLAPKRMYETMVDANPHARMSCYSLVGGRVIDAREYPYWYSGRVALFSEPPQEYYYRNIQRGGKYILEIKRAGFTTLHIPWENLDLTDAPGMGVVEIHSAAFDDIDDILEMI